MLKSTRRDREREREVRALNQHLPDDRV